ncbi:NADH:ubiquinone reductase (Na(+)-transporting) subunit D [bacterium]|nr:NADH:ubiquinone reductase (Na(+)-transporting) subunit D [Actinomycetota bacterium]MBE32968.1 NADH:ubiquinone reductase (Na(+)-transporting) subunit D [bacterium]|tara:strand:- start:7635 stop:8264 length:630 start_codon:yes stop_codon:yes gene_type:complete
MSFLKSKAYKTFKKPLIEANPISIAILGICSSLAVTTQIFPSIIMVLAMTFVLTFSNITISILRHVIPKNIRIIVELVVVSSLVILADQLLKAFLFDVSKQLSVFVGLIITNCIIMGRAEAFALANGPWLSFWDGLGNGLGYGYILIVVGFFRELFGAGSLFGIKVVPDFLYQIGYVDMGLMLLAPGAFILIGILVWIQNIFTGQGVEH